MKTKIYLVENCYDDPNKVYIGKTKGNRYYKHTYKFGKQITYTYIDEIESLEREDWEPLETKWIKHYIDLGYNVLNIRKKGGSGVNFCTTEHKNKIGNANRKPKPKGFGSLISNNKERSNNIKQSLSKINRGPAISEGRKKPIQQLDMNGKIMETFGSKTEAEIITKIKGIANVTSGLSKSAGGYFWKYL